MSSSSSTMAARPPSAKVSLAIRCRKPVRSVSTNISHYDRTDPFAAFNSLRKLLSFLPSKVGGAQYKLTPEEHKLSLHLLTIVEPFIGISPSRQTIARQPNEILDNIVFFIDSQRDLLSFGLTCQRMHNVVFPRHFHYRVIRARVSSLRVWNHLIVHRAFARNVRRLEILDERDSDREVIPSGITSSDTDIESTDDELGIHVKQEKLLVTALNKMTALKSFKWSCNHSLVSIETVWPILVKCTFLQQVEINDNSMFIPLGEESEGGEESAPRKPAPTILHDLTSISFKSAKASYGVTKHPKLTRLSVMLTHCPNLRTLQIGYNQRRGAGSSKPSADALLLCGRWKNLASLTLDSLWCSTQGVDSLSVFLASHANLEVLNLDIAIGGGGASLALSPNSLPHLRELKCNKEFAIAIMECSADKPRPLEIIKGVKLSGLEWDRTFFQNLKKAGNKISRIELSGWNELEDIRRLAECVPKLTWLDMGKRGSGNTHKTTFVNNVNEWTMLLSLLPELATLHGIRFFYEVASGPLCVSDRSRVKKNDETASVLAWKCPKLRRLDHWEEASGKVIVLLRDEVKVKYEVRRVKADPKI